MIPPRRNFGPVAGPAVKRVSVGEGERFCGRVALAHDVADTLARQRIQEGLGRPADSHRAEIEAAHLVWIPLWRVVLDVGGREVVRVVPARQVLPVDPSAAVDLAVRDLLPGSARETPEGEWIEPDVARDEAESQAAAALRRPVLPRRLREVEVRVRGAVLVHLPVWLRRYRYEGEASAGVTEECHVALQAANGRVVSERHPAVWRALAGRLRRVFTRG